MVNRALEEGGEVASIEVRVYRHGDLIRRELCESDEQASLVVDEWAELEGVTCEVDDLSVRHGTDQILGPEAPERWDGDYPEQAEGDVERGHQYPD